MYATSAYSTSLSHYALAAFVQAAACYILQKRQEKLTTLRNTFAYKSIVLLCGGGQSTYVYDNTAFTRRPRRKP